MSSNQIEGTPKPIGALFHEAVTRMVRSFEARAKDLYGTPEGYAVRDDEKVDSGLSRSTPSSRAGLVATASRAG